MHLAKWAELNGLAAVFFRNYCWKCKKRGEDKKRLKSNHLGFWNHCVPHTLQPFHNAAPAHHYYYTPQHPHTAATPQHNSHTPQLPYITTPPHRNRHTPQLPHTATTTHRNCHTLQYPYFVTAPLTTRAVRHSLWEMVSFRCVLT